MVDRFRTAVWWWLVPCFLIILGCQNESTVPADPFQERNKLSFELPADVDADLYRISVTTPEGDSVVYFEHATSSTIEVAVPAAGQSVVVVNAYKNNTLVFSGSSLVETGELAKKQLRRQTINPPLPPEIPVLQLADGKIMLTWSSPLATELFKIYRTNDIETAPTFIGSTQALTFTDASVEPGLTYYYRLTAKNAAGESTPSGYASIAVPGIIVPNDTDTVIVPHDTVSVKKAPAVPQNVRAAVSGTIDVAVSWDLSPEAVSYTIFRSVQGVSAGPQKIGTIAAPPFTDLGKTPGTTVGYSVAAVNEAGESAPSAIAWVTLPTAEKPATPQNVAAKAVSEKSISVSWTPVENAKSFTVEWSLQKEGPYTSATSTSSEYIITGLSSSKLYYIRVTAVNGAGQSAPSATISASTSAPPLQAPSAPVVTAGTITDSSIQIIWQQVTNAESYIVERSTSASGTFTPVCSTSALSYTSVKLLPATPYYFRALAQNSAGKSVFSTTISATTAAAEIKLVPPAGFKKDSVTATSAALSWQTAENATNYVVYRAASSGGSFTALDTISSIKFTDNNLTAATTYQYKVSSLNGKGESAQSTALSVTTSAAAPLTPSGLTASAASATSMTIKFTAVTGATGYKLYWSTGSAGPFTAISITATTYTHTGLTVNTAYYYKISAMKQTVESPLSAVVSAKTQAASTKVAVIGGACNGCGKCVSSCKTGAIKRSGRVYIIDASLCDGDGACVSKCPKRAITVN